MIPQIGVYKAQYEAVMPVKSSVSNSLYDICSCITGPVNGFDSYNEPIRCIARKDRNGVYIELEPGARLKIPTGLEFDVPVGFHPQYHPLMGLSQKKGLILSTHEKEADSSSVHGRYIWLSNLLKTSVKVRHKAQLCQIEIVQNTPFELVEYTSSRNIA